jgi:hypothetical protein
VRGLVGLELHAAKRRVVRRDRGQVAVADVREGAQPRQVPSRLLDLVVAQREEFLDLVQLVLVGGRDVAVSLGRLHGFVGVGDAAVVARIGHAQLLAHLLDLLQVLGVQLSVGDASFTFSRKASFSCLLEPALDAVLDSHFRPQRMSAERSSPTISAVSSDFDLYFKSVFPTLRQANPSR